MTWHGRVCVMTSISTTILLVWWQPDIVLSGNAWLVFAAASTWRLFVSLSVRRQAHSRLLLCCNNFPLGLGLAQGSRKATFFISKRAINQRKKSPQKNQTKRQVATSLNMYTWHICRKNAFVIKLFVWPLCHKYFPRDQLLLGSILQPPGL